MGLMTGGKGGGKKSLASKPNLLSALRVQTSTYGQVIPIVYGQNRISGRLLWSGDFAAIPHTSTQKVGGKGLGSGGGNAITNTTYTYQTAVAIALCLGPIQNIHNVWDTKGKLTMISSSVQFTVPGGGGSVNVIPPGAGIFHSGRGVSRGDSYSLLADDFGSDGPVTLNGTQNTPMALLAGGTPGLGQYTQSGNSFTFSASDAGKTMTINYVYSVPDSNSNGQPLQKLSLTLFLGERPQTPWSYLTSRHAGQNLGYNGVAYIASSAMDLGESGTLPNLSFEVLGVLPFGGNSTDAEPSAIITDLIDNPFYGLGGAVPLDNQSASNSFAQFRNFCVANGIFLSPVLDAQKSAAQWIQEILDVTNSAAVWSEGLLKIVPYGDTTAVGNGASFIPNTAPVYDLTNNDFLKPVTVKRPSIADVMNSVSVEFVNRANDYNVEVAEDKDEAMITVYGLRKAEPKQAHSITTADVAKFVANLLRKRAVEIRATYTLKLGWQFNLLEPMDLVTITVPELGYSKKPVRITAIREDDTGQLEMDAEDFPFGTAQPTLYPQQQPSAFAPQANADPGSVNAPVVFEAPLLLSRSGQHEIWIAVSGSDPSWGGCHVWLSLDNSEYHQIGRISGPARMGSLSGAVAAGADPDHTNFFPVDLTESAGTLQSGTQADADSYRTLCYAGGEFIAYQAANLTGANTYNVGQDGGGSVYLRRGLFGSSNVAHAAGESFVRVDDAIFDYVYDPAFIGKTIYLKFTSFNTSGLMEQSIANAAAYQFVVAGKYLQCESVSKNLLDNSGIELNSTLTPLNATLALGQRASDGWTVIDGPFFGYASAASFHSVLLEDNISPHTGRRNFLIRLKSSITIASDSTWHGTAVRSDYLPVKPGESYSWGGYVGIWANATLPANVDVVASVRAALYDVNHNFIIEANAAQSWVKQRGELLSPTTAYSQVDAEGIIPSSVNGQIPAYMVVYAVAYLDNNSGSAFNTGGLLYCDARFDDLYFYPQWNPSTNDIAKVGSMSVTYTGGLTYSSTTSSITWSWNLNANRTNLAMTVSNFSGSQAITGLGLGTTYNFYPFIDELNNVVGMVSTGGIGSPSWAHSGTSIAWSQEQARADHYPLSSTPMTGATTSSGSGGGSGGGIGGACLRDDMLVLERTKGIIPVRDLRAGDWIGCPEDPDTPEGWAKVINVNKGCVNREWVHTRFNVDDELITTPGHPFTLQDGSMKRAAELCLEDAVPCTTGITYPVSHGIEKYCAFKVSVTIRSRRHVFYAGAKAPCILQHNFQPNS